MSEHPVKKFPSFPIKFNKQAFFIALITLAIILPFWGWGYHTYKTHLLDTKRTEFRANLASYGNVLTLAINTRFELLSGIKAFTDVHLLPGNMHERFAEEFTVFAAGLHKPGIRNFVIAPDGINQHVYPPEGNEAVPGHNQFADPRPVARADANRAKESGELVITGPYELRQGGFGLVARQAVYHDPTQSEFWGMVSMVLDMPPILSAAGLDNPDNDISLALRTTDDDVFFGDPDIFNQQPVVYTVKLLDGEWELAGIPTAGWNASIYEPLLLASSTTLLSVLLVALLSYSIMYQHQQMAGQVAGRTQALTHTNQQLQQEIAERTEIEQQFAFQAQLLDSVRESVVAADLAGLVTYWSKGAEALYGYSAAEMLGQSVMKLLPESERSREQSRMIAVQRTGQWSGQYQQQHKDGSLFWADTVISLAKDRQGRPIGFVGIDRNITTQLEAKAALEASEQQYRLLAENISDVISIIDKNLAFTYVSPSIIRLSGHTPEEFLQLTMADILTPESLSNILAAHQQRQQKLVHDQQSFYPIILELEHIRKNGFTFWAEDICVPIFDEKNKTDGYMVTTRDITERKLAEFALRQSERRFRDVLETINLLAIMLDKNGTIIFCNDFLLAVTGRQRDEIMGQSWFDLFIPQDIRATVFEVFENTIQTAAFPTHYENEILTKSGGRRSITWNNTIYRDAQGHIAGITSIGIDITEQKATAAALRESEQQFQTILSTITDYVWHAKIVDGQVRYSYYSPVVESITGHPPDYFMSGPEAWLSIIHPEDRTEAREKIEHELEGTSIVTHEYRIIRPDGQIRWLYGTTTPRGNEEGQIIDLTGVTSDITERKVAQRQMEASLREKEVLLREIHHRVKNNLQIISSLLSLQSNTISDANTLQVLQDSQSRVRSMSLVHETLYQSPNLAKIEMSKYIVKVTRHLFMAYRRENTNVKLHTHIDAVQLDLEQAIPCGLIINELVSNALKHAFSDDAADPDDSITVSLRRLDKPHLELSIADNGVGLPPDFQTNQKQTLGLQLVEILTDQLNGVLSITSGNGARFTVTFSTDS